MTGEETSESKVTFLSLNLPSELESKDLELQPIAKLVLQVPEEGFLAAINSFNGQGNTAQTHGV